jgi:hypothetical protein
MRIKKCFKNFMFKPMPFGVCYEACCPDLKLDGVSLMIEKNVDGNFLKKMSSDQRDSI